MKKRKVLAWILAVSITITNGSIAFAAENTTNIESSEQATDITEQNIEIEHQEMDAYGASTEGQTEDGFSYTITDGQATITEYNGNSTVVEIPETVEGTVPVTALASNLFLDNVQIEEVTISKNVVSFGQNPEIEFLGTYSLKCINVKNGNSRFYDIDGVLFERNSSDGTPMLATYPAAKEGSTYTIPDDTDYICGYAFYGCSNLNRITIPPSVSSVFIGAFSNFADTTIILQQTAPSQIHLVDSCFFYLTNCNIIVKNQEMKNAVETKAAGATPIDDTCTNTTVKIAGDSDLDDSYRTPATSLVLTDTETASKSITLAPKESQAVSYTISPADTTDSVTWESSNPEVAAVTVKNGKVTVTGVANGECTITGKDESGHALTLNINVWQEVTETELRYVNTVEYTTYWVSNPTNTIEADSEDFYELIYFNIYPYNAKYKANVTWKSSNPDIISVEKQREFQVDKTYYSHEAALTLKKPGTATITATLTDGLNVITRSVAIKVTNSGGTVTESPKQDTNPEETVTEPPKQDTPRPEKKSQKITNVCSSYKKAYKNSFTLKPKAKTSCSYKTSNSKVATVSSKGKVTIKGTGKATITITAKATTNYKSATKKVTIYAVPAKLKTPAVTAGRKSLTMKWSKDSKADGYQIQYSTSSKFKKATTVTFSKKTVKKTIKKLKKGKKYYVRIRAYKKIGNKKYYGTWSKVKNVKVK